MSFSDALFNHIDQERPAVRRGLGRALVTTTASVAFAAAAGWIGFGDAWPMAVAASLMSGACFAGALARAISVFRALCSWRARRRVAELGVPRSGVLCGPRDWVEQPTAVWRSVPVLLSNDADVSADLEFMAYLAARVEKEWPLGRLRGRRSLPLNWTDGAAVVLVRVRVSAAHLRRGVHGRPWLVCMVASGETGRLVPVPAWIPLPTGQESRPAAGNRL